MSLYADYLRERTDDEILETENGFATYRILNESQVYIMDIYVIPKERLFGIARKLGDEICERAKNIGCTELIGTVNPSCYGANESIKTLLAYGMDVYASNENVIYFKKRI